MRKRYQRMQMFERTCRIYSEELQRFLCALTKNDQFAMEEIYQNTMLGALTGLNYLRDSRKMKAWLFAIARAESGRYYAASRIKNPDTYRIKTEEELINLDHPLDFTKYIEDRECIKSLMRKLSEYEQQLYILHYYYDLPLKAISEILNLNYNTTRSMHIRGMAKMRKQLSERKELYGH